MSLALVIHAGQSDVSRHLTAGLGLLMSVALLLPVLAQSDSGAGGRWWLSLGCAAACAAWCCLLCRRSGRRPLHQLRLAADGRLYLVAGESGESKVAVLAGAWRVGCLICLRVSVMTKVDRSDTHANDPQSPSAFELRNCTFMLARSSFDEASWHGLRRWLVWHRRSRVSPVVVAQSAEPARHA